MLEYLKDKAAKHEENMRRAKSGTPLQRARRVWNNIMFGGSWQNDVVGPDGTTFREGPNRVYMTISPSYTWKGVVNNPVVEDETDD